MRFPTYQPLFHRLLLQLKELQRDRDRLDTLHELQRQLIRAILAVEKRVLRLKKARHRLSRLKARERLSKERSIGVKTLTEAIDTRVSDLHQVMFLLRCIGDGIAFTYQSKYALKHLMFDENYRAKQMPGFISGKKGFLREYRVLCSGFKAGIPVLLADITNIIRHGDVCAMAGPDPVPLEVKSSRTKRNRPQRQLDQLHALADFYRNDGAANFRGHLNVRRTELHTSETTYEPVMNDCLREALRQGHAMRQPEEGLRYIAVRTDQMDSGVTEALEEFLFPYVSRRCLTVNPTPEPTWWHMRPFTLTMDLDNALAFMHERVVVFVVVDLQVLKQLFREVGVQAVMLFDGASAFQISLESDWSRGAFRVSEQYFLRVTHEFLSPSWFVGENVAFLANVDKHVPVLSSPPTAEEFASMVPWDSPQLEAWRNVRDYWEDLGGAEGA